ncbi:phage tail protein (plasmid) [Pseudoalteromonas sp. T1lg65]|uniref:phage tail protein n=1 Tax=Pseudoalteromonas sp. T1lg65 TaxID=2077101 RepID=UPI003F7A3FE9
MSEGAYQCEMMPFAGNFAVRDYAECRGQYMAIAQYQAVYSLLGTIYGGDGRTTFALPDLRGRSPIGYGQAPGLEPFRLGQTPGQESIRLNVNQLPSHTHMAQTHVSVVSKATATLAVAENPANLQTPNEDCYIGTAQNPSFFKSTPLSKEQLVEIKGPEVDVQSAASAIVNILSTGTGNDIDIRNPSVAINWQICILGLYPSRA